jgi:F0F1-type ATP synthase membrane subunit c/vacuolar-type H+-ATPase subunit K
LTEKYFLLAFIGLTKKLMSLRNLMFAGALALSSCASGPEKSQENNHGGLSPMQAKIAGKVVEGLARNPKQAEALGRKGAKKAHDYLERHPDEKAKYKAKLRNLLEENPDIENLLKGVLQ